MHALEGAAATGTTAATFLGNVDSALHTIIAIFTVAWWVRLLWAQRAKPGPMPPAPNIDTKPK